MLYAPAVVGRACPSAARSRLWVVRTQFGCYCCECAPWTLLSLAVALDLPSSDVA